MAFYIELEDLTSVVWNAPAKKPRLPRDTPIDVFQADGDELEYIIFKFPNLPHCRPICRWTGELATFIYSNL